MKRQLLLLAGCVSAALCAAPSLVHADPVKVLFVGNSYTFGRLNPVLTYNAANVTDLTQPQGALRTDNSGAPFTNVTGTNSYAPGTPNPATHGLDFPSFTPHSTTVEWGGVPGIFKQFTVQAGLNYDVSLSTRNAASLRGHFLNTANANWDLRGNIDNQRWDQVVLQEQSDEALPPKTVGSSVLGSNYPSFAAYANLIENWIHQGTALSYRERAMYNTIFGNQANCVAAGGTVASCDNNTLRSIAANANANAAAQVFLMQPWARPNLVNPPGTNTVNPQTGDAIYNLSQAAPSFYASLAAVTADNTAGYMAAMDFADNDGSGGCAGIVPVGQAFMRAIADGIATPDMYAPGAASDGLIDLWFNDGTHASVLGSYLSALTLFGQLTGVDPASLGPYEIAARDLGISPREAALLQRVARDQLGLPNPPALALVLAAFLALGLVKVRARA